MVLSDRRLGEKTQDFDSIIEGTLYDAWNDLQYSPSLLQVRPGINVLNDGRNKYVFHGITKDFKTIDRSSSKVISWLTARFYSPPEKSEMKMKHPLKNVGMLHFDTARSAVLRDGRIFVDSGINEDQKYLNSLKNILQASRELLKFHYHSELVNSELVHRHISRYSIMKALEERMEEKKNQKVIGHHKLNENPAKNPIHLYND